MVEVSLTLLPPPVAFLRSVLELFEQFLHFTMILAQHSMAFGIGLLL
jgi:hypothetical protein